MTAVEHNPRTLANSHQSRDDVWTSFRRRHRLLHPIGFSSLQFSVILSGCILHAVFFSSQAIGSLRELPPAVQDSRDTDHETIRKLIKQLGDDHYLARDEAESKLLKIGGPAIDQLRQATSLRGNEAPDGEVQLRATRLLILIERKERERQILAFLEGNEDGIDLAGWDDFSKINDSDRFTRQLFVDMHQAQPELLAAIRKGKSAVEAEFQRASKQSMRSGGTSATDSLGTLVAALFVSSLEFEAESGTAVEKIAVSDVDLRRIQVVLTQPQMVTFVNSSGQRKQIVNLISQWLNSLPDEEASKVNIQLLTIKAYELKDQIDSVISFASNPEVPLLTRASAIEVISNLATADDLSKLEPLLNDESVAGSYLPPLNVDTDKPASADVVVPESHEDKNPPAIMHVQIRDLALIAALKILRLDVRQFGFNPKCINGTKIIRNKSGFFSDQTRALAFEKWGQLTTNN